MNVIVPYTKRLPEVIAALLDAEWVDVSGWDDSYWRLLAGRWALRQTVIVVEHDIVPDEFILAEMSDCPADWCAAGYDFERFGLIYGLGCTKFSGALMARVPDALNRVAALKDARHPARHWCNLDDRLQGVLRQHGEQMHHHGAVRHLEPNRSHDCE